MKLQGVIPNFYIHVSGSNLYIPKIGLIGISIFLYCMKEHWPQQLEGMEGQGTDAKQILAAVPCPSLCSCS
jgi:hypothetical protein